MRRKISLTSEFIWFDANMSLLGSVSLFSLTFNRVADVAVSNAKQFGGIFKYVLELHTIQHNVV